VHGTDSPSSRQAEAGASMRSCGRHEAGEPSAPDEIGTLSWLRAVVKPVSVQVIAAAASPDRRRIAAMFVWAAGRRAVGNAVPADTGIPISLHSPTRIARCGSRHADTHAGRPRQAADRG